MRKKKEPETSPDMQIRYRGDGTKIMPLVKGKPIYPEVCDSAGTFMEVLKVLAAFDPERFGGESAHSIKGLIHLARHFCDVHGLDYQEIDKLAHIDYSGDRWDAQSKHFGDKA